jgi:hypothetical protein
MCPYASYTIPLCCPSISAVRFSFFFLLVQISAAVKPIIKSAANVTPRPTPTFAPVLSPVDSMGVVLAFEFVTLAGVLSAVVGLCVDADAVGGEDVVVESGVSTGGVTVTVLLLLNDPLPPGELPASTDELVSSTSS